MLRIADTSSHQAPEVETNYTFPLDPFQKCAVAAIQARENVLVTAKTGSGKTLVGEYQIEYSLKRGGRVGVEKIRAGSCTTSLIASPKRRRTCSG